MNTKIILSTSAIILGLIGLTLTFIPQETLVYLNIEVNPTLTLFVQVAGAFYFAFAMLNWMSKGALIGGIYNRPVAVANLTHFMIGGLALLKGIFAYSKLPIIISILTIVYIVYGITFAVIFFKHPVAKNA